jgi:hypothetical protein
MRSILVGILTAVILVVVVGGAMLLALDTMANSAKNETMLKCGAPNIVDFYHLEDMEQRVAVYDTDAVADCLALEGYRIVGMKLWRTHLDRCMNAYKIGTEQFNCLTDAGIQLIW